MGKEQGLITWPNLGVGVGLRPIHYPYIFSHRPPVAWFEATSENYMDSGGRPLQNLEKVRKNYPVVLHGVSLSIGSMDPLSQTYLTRLKNLVSSIEPAMVSDHLCWSGVDGVNLHDLLPLPYTDEAVAHVTERIDQVQNFLARRILIENVSSYITFDHSEMAEWDFLREISQKADCGILLDVNNVYVNAFNHQFDAKNYIDALPKNRIGQIHLAGHTDCETYLFDTHDFPITNPVWDLYRYTVDRLGQLNTLIEWDGNIPEFPKLLEEAQHAEKIQRPKE